MIPPSFRDLANEERTFGEDFPTSEEGLSFSLLLFSSLPTLSGVASNRLFKSTSCFSSVVSFLLFS